MPRRTPRTAFVRLRTPRGIHGFLKSASVCALIAGLLSQLSPAVAAQPAAEATTTADGHCGGQRPDILPPGQNGNAALARILLNQPAHAEDRL
jgi:hypothetical protein